MPPVTPLAEALVMHYIRVVMPAGVTGQVVGSLCADSGVRNLVVLPAAGRPSGDCVQFDVTDESASAVLQRLSDLSLDRGTHISVEAIDAAIGGPETQTDR